MSLSIPIPNNASAMIPMPLRLDYLPSQFLILLVVHLLDAVLNRGHGERGIVDVAHYTLYSYFHYVR